MISKIWRKLALALTLCMALAAFSACSSSNGNDDNDGGGGNNPVTEAGAAVNARNSVQMGDYLYIISYDVPRISKINLTTEELVSSVEFNKIDGKPTNGQDIVIADNGKIYALFTAAVNIGGATQDAAGYSRSLVVEVLHTNDDEAPKFGNVTAKVGKNAQRLVPAGNYIYAPAVGGPQMFSGGNNGRESTIERVNLNDMSSEVVYIEDDGAYDIYDLAVGDDYALILRFQNGTYPSASSLQVLYVDRVNFDSAISGAITSVTDELIEDDVYGWYRVVFHDDVFKQFWIVDDNALRVYSGDLLEEKELPFSELYGSAGAVLNTFTLIADKYENPTDGSRVAAYIAADSYYQNFQLGLIKGHSDVMQIQVDRTGAVIPPHNGQYAPDVKIYSYSSSPKSSVATFALERYFYSSGNESVISIFDVDMSGMVSISNMNYLTDWGGSLSN